MFWKDLSLIYHIPVNFVVKKNKLFYFCVYVYMCIFDALFYTENKNGNCKEQHVMHVFIFLGKFHIHKKNLAQCKPFFAHFINYIKLYVNLLEQTKKQKPCNVLKLESIDIYVIFFLHFCLFFNVLTFFSLWQLMLIWSCEYVIPLVLVALNQ